LAKKNSFFVASESNDASGDVLDSSLCITEEAFEGSIDFEVVTPNSRGPEEHLSAVSMHKSDEEGDLADRMSAMNMDLAAEQHESVEEEGEEEEEERKDVEEEQEEEEEEEYLEDGEDGDEWEDDEDVGYVVLKITEQEFFEMEEVSPEQGRGGQPTQQIAD
jgi:hypothetical protein